LRLHRWSRRALPARIHCVEYEYNSGVYACPDAHHARLSYPSPPRLRPGTDQPKLGAVGLILGRFVSRSSCCMLIAVLVRWRGWDGWTNSLACSCGGIGLISLGERRSMSAVYVRASRLASAVTSKPWRAERSWRFIRATWGT